MLDVEHIYEMSKSLYKCSCFCTCWYQSSTNCAILPSWMGEHGVRRYCNRLGQISSLVVFTMPVGKTIKSISSKTYAPGEPFPESGQNGRTSNELWSPGWCICICKRHTKRTVFVYSVFVFLRIMQIDLCRDYHGLSTCIKPWDPYGPTGANMTSRITMHCYDGDDD